MKRVILIFVAMILISSCISAEIIINQQPQPLYNTGDIIKTSFKVLTPSDLDADTFFNVNLICNGIETKIMQTPIGDMKAGEEKEFSPPIPLLIGLIGRTTGTCKIKAVLQSISDQEYDYSLTNEFEISDSINLEIKTEKTEFNPEESIILEGNALKENGKPVNGIVELRVTKANESLVEKIDSVKNGYIYLNFSLPSGSKAEEYTLNLNVYEVNSNAEKINQGFTTYAISIKQVPTNLEIIFENQEIEPGTNLKVKGVLHDQTGETISSIANITIKKNNSIITQVEQQTDEFFELPINYNEFPGEGFVKIISEGIDSEASYKILEKEDVKVELINRTLMITNIGNVLYNKSVSVKIGNESLNVNVNLAVDEQQKYTLTAPDGEYNIEVISDEGNEINEMAMLTGKAIEVKESKEGIGSLVAHPLVWIFITVILGLVAFLIFKKGHKRIFFGRTPKEKKDKKKEKSEKEEEFEDETILKNSKNKAELSLSIKGDKQNVSIVCLKIKNFKDIKSKKSSISETLQNIEKLVEENKALTYENQESIFFIISPTRTRTFKNEKTAIKLAQKLQELLKNHNKVFKQIIEFGIAVNYGTIIAKQEKQGFKFMSMGTLITASKKVASISEEEILLTENIKMKLGADVKTAKEEKNNMTIYKITEIKNREENQKFITNFIKRLEKKD